MLTASKLPLHCLLEMVKKWIFLFKTVWGRWRRRWWIRFIGLHKKFGIWSHWHFHQSFGWFICWIITGVLTISSIVVALEKLLFERICFFLLTYLYCFIIPRDQFKARLAYQVVHHKARAALHRRIRRIIKYNYSVENEEKSLQKLAPFQKIVIN